MNRRTKTIVTGSFLFIAVAAVYIAGLFISEEAVGADFSRTNLPPSFSHLFGTDWLGRDIFLRTVKGLGISLALGTTASAASAVIALLVGIAAASGSKKLDGAVNWIIDLVMGVPHLVLLILISFAAGKGMRGLFIGITATHWTSLSRIIRAEVLQLRSQQYILVSRRLGHSNIRILRSHILPHMIPQFMIGLVLLFPHAILHESALSFLGYGLPPDQPAVGIILAESMKHLTTGMWWLAVFPGLSLVLIVIAIEKLGDSLKKIFDPYSAQE